MFHWMKRTFAYGSAIAVSRSTVSFALQVSWQAITH